MKRGLTHNETVERVARAICEASGELWGERPDIPAVGFHGYDFDALNNHWRHKARAAIAASMERVAELEAALKAARGLLCCSIADRDSTMRRMYDEARRQEVLDQIDASLPSEDKRVS
jgi:hypothetical protein